MAKERDKRDAKNSRPRKQMEEIQVNIWGVRRSPGVRSLQAKIEERVL